MPLYAYTGFNAQGRKVSGVTEAPGEKGALQRLRNQGIFPTELREESGEAAEGLSASWLRRRQRVPVNELASATRQLATLLSAGLSLDEALKTLGEQMTLPALRRALERARQEVVQGESFSRALERQGGMFPPLYVSMVDVGEQSGTLDDSLRLLADLLEKQAQVKARVQASLAYPALMALVGLGVVGFLFAYVVPKIIRIVEETGQQLPLPTRILLGLSHFSSRFGWLLALLLVAAVIAFWRYRRTPAGRMATDRLLLRSPLWGRFAVLQLSARFCRTLAVLLRSGVPLLKALDICRNLMDNAPLREAIDQTTASAREGEGIALPLRRTGLFPPMMLQMIAVGEKSGDLDGMLLKVAESYERQLDLDIGRYLSLLEPVMILVMGAIVGFVVLAILLPIFQASQGLG